MRINIVKIGNSRGIRIPSFILKECDFTNEVELKVIRGNIVLSPIKTTRAGWDGIYSDMHENQDDSLILNDSLDLDSEDWEW